LAGPIDVNNVLGIVETVFESHIMRPRFDSLRLNFDGDTTAAANEMVMVARGAGPKKVFALEGQRISAAVLR